jgi:hypothetical protein
MSNPAGMSGLGRKGRMKEPFKSSLEKEKE